MELEAGVLAYVFWHWPRLGAAADAYEQDLTAFHDRLRGAGVPGLRAAATFRLGQAPWADAVAAPPRPPVYEDWYVVSGFAALEQLKTAAVGADLVHSHDRAAAAAAGGTAGLYALRTAGATAATGAVADLPVAHWLTKPQGMSYAEFDAIIERVVPNVPVWQRQLTLGPGAEFCMAAPAAVTIPAELAPRIIPRAPIT